MHFSGVEMGPMSTYRLANLCIITLFSIALGRTSVTAQTRTNGEAPRTLTTVREVHELPAFEAAKELPVHIRAQVTYFNQYSDKRHASMFVHDATGGIFVLVPIPSSWPQGAPVAGSLVDIRGVSSPGDYAAIIGRPEIQILGKSRQILPAKRVTLPHLLTGVEDSQLVEISGVVQSVFQTDTNVVLEIAMQDGTISAVTVKDKYVDYVHLIDSRIRLRGNAAALFNHDRQLTGFRIMFPDLASITVDRSGAGDPFNLPLRSISSLSRFEPETTSFHMVHLRGTVTLQWPEKLVCFQDQTRPLCAQSQEAVPLEVGQTVDVAGFVALGGYRPTLFHAVFEPGRKGHAPHPSTVSVQQALGGNYDGELVTIKGRLLSYDLATKDKTLLLTADGVLFPVILPSGSDATDLASLKTGSTLQVKGICAVDLDTQMTSRGDGHPVITSFRVLLQSPQDVAILESPSWWTPVHSLMAFGVAAILAIAVLGWVVVLRRRVYQQTKMLRESEERFRHMAQHDALTGLPTRMLLHDRLQMALERSRRFKTLLAVLMIDLDNFKHVNDSFGHDAGDQTLRTTAERILEAIRGSDTAARMGGDEFIVLLSDIADAQEAELIADRIRTSLSRPIRATDCEIPISASIGVCTVSEGNIDAAMLLKKVDVAMYHAKARGRNCFEVFNGDLAEATLGKFELLAELSKALEREELEVHYQPMVSFEDGRISGFEALVRWRSRKLGLIMPNDFISIAEESGLIVPIGEWVLRKASLDVAELERQHDTNYLLAVNLSPRQLLHPDLAETVERIFAECKRPYNSLTLEVTETTLLSDAQVTQKNLAKIKSLGVQLAIDDFGVGFSSLSYVTRFPTDWIKIDRSLICNCTTDRSSVAVLRAIVAMARALDIRLVAEGVETEEQFLLLQKEQCNVVQGYYFSKPLSLADLSDFIRGSAVYSSLEPALQIDSPASLPQMLLAS